VFFCVCRALGLAIACLNVPSPLLCSAAYPPRPQILDGDKYLWQALGSGLWPVMVLVSEIVQVGGSASATVWCWCWQAPWVGAAGRGAACRGRRSCPRRQQLPIALLLLCLLQH
jgi:hypothetical protein